MRFDLTGWTEVESSPDRIVWRNEFEEVLSLNMSGGLDNSPEFNDTVSMRQWCRELAQRSGAGILSADFVDVDSSRAISLIYKRQEGRAYFYTGMLIIPVPHCAYIFVVASGEKGMTGVRDAIVSGTLLERGELEFEMFDEPDSSGASGRIKGWLHDPYDADYDGTILHSLADHEGFDQLVPDHPLTHVRNQLRTLHRSIRLPERLLPAEGDE